MDLWTQEKAGTEKKWMNEDIFVTRSSTYSSSPHFLLFTDSHGGPHSITPLMRDVGSHNDGEKR